MGTSHEDQKLPDLKGGGARSTKHLLSSPTKVTKNSTGSWGRHHHMGSTEPGPWYPPEPTEIFLFLLVSRKWF